MAEHDVTKRYHFTQSVVRDGLPPLILRDAGPFKATALFFFFVFFLLICTAPGVSSILNFLPKLFSFSHSGFDVSLLILKGTFYKIILNDCSFDVATMNGEVSLIRIHNLLALGAPYQMEPGSKHCTKERHSHSREDWFTEGVLGCGGEELQQWGHG